MGREPRAGWPRDGDPGGPRATTVLVHSPLTGPEAWGLLPTVLRDRGHDVVVVDVRDDDAPPYAVAVRRPGRPAGARGLRRRPRHAGRALRRGLPAAAARRRPASGPGTGGGVRLPGRRAAAGPADQPAGPDARRGAGGGRRAGGPAGRRRPVPGLDRRRPARAGPGRRGARVAGRRAPPPGRGLLHRDPAGRAGLAGRACAASSGSRPATTRPPASPRLRGWPCVLGPDDRPGGHFAALVDPDAVADDLEALLARM